MSLEPYIPPASITRLRSLAESAEIITTDGEIIEASAADDASLVAWHRIASEMRIVARLIEQSVDGELLTRCRAIAGPIKTEYGDAKESISRSSVSGASSQKIRDILERYAADGTIPWDAVDNIAPLQAHVTPAKIQNYLDVCPTQVADELEPHLPEKRRTLKIDTLA